MFNKLRDIICEYVEVDKDAITVDSRFVEDLGFTSYDFMSMVGELEDTFDVEVEEREVADIVTVGEAVRYIESLQD
ncbi:acyl carrier protein [Clostridium sp. AF19-22AC]|jgi:acyl carrier protein|uniref:acyl carrier protein n=1 Tax=Clostridia TaxID=186801 RepID=UPI000E46EA3F|nr:MULTISPECIES: acyl carrier protein [Clostridia]RHR24201.1 acyl carrier protein [Clostridium sp. AF19-22AC]